VDATRYLAQVEADLLRGSWADPKLGRVTFGEWVEQWRPTTANLRPGTLVLYDYQLRRFLLPAFGSVPLGRLDTMTVRAWLAELHREAEVTPTTIAKAYRLLRRILNVAVEAGYLPRNPCTVKGAGIERAAEMRHASIPQLHELADALPGADPARRLWRSALGRTGRTAPPPGRPGRRSGSGGGAGCRGRREDHREPAQDGSGPAGSDPAEDSGGGAR
jgi:hypothetical protein